MATAAELLAGVVEVDKTLIIDNAFRTINIPSSVPNLGVEYDDDVLRLDFKMPRYVSNTDLSGFGIRINYINAKGEPDAYTVKDAVVGSQYITFSWLVGPTATRYKGNTKFNVCAKTLKADGKDDEGNTIYVVDREFNTTIATLPVLEGLEVDEAIVSEYSDLIEQWRRDLFGIGDTEEASIKAVSQNEQTAIANKGAEVLATIPADYQTAVNMTDNAERTKADAIICTAEGDIVTVADSSDDYLRGLRIFGKTTQVSTTGKQLINVSQTTKTNNGITFTPNPDGSVHVKGTATANAYFIFDSNNPVPMTETELIASISGSDQVYMVVGYFTSDGTIVNSIASVDDKTTNTFVYPAAAVTTRTFLGVNTGKTVDAMVYPLVRLASNPDDSYEPYSGGFASPSPDWPQPLNGVENPTVNIFGKNLLKIVASNQTINGVTFTINSDQSVTIKGTATASVYYGLNYDIKTLIPGQAYTLTGTPTGGSGSTYRLYAQTINGTKFAGDNGNGVNFVATDDQWQVLFAVYNGNTVDFTVYPQVRLKSITDSTFEPYKEVPIQTFNRTLPAIPVSEGGNYTDTSGQQWVCDEIDLERGVYVERVRECELTGDDRWVVSGVQAGVKEGFTRYDGSVTTPGTAMNESLWSHFQYKGTYVNDGYGAWVHSGNDSRVGVRVVTPHESVEALSEDLAAKYAAGTPVKFQYILAKPIETPLTAEEIQWFRFAHTNFPNTTVFNDAGATMELTYNADTTTYLNNLPKATDEQVQAAVNAYLDANLISAEGASF